jgi:1-acyl-sn-glycerol-3-phosphate acyltransferase
VRRPARWKVAAQNALCALVRVLVGAYPVGPAINGAKQSIYFANHTSHLDTLVVLAALSVRARTRTRAVAARDYWGKPGFKNWIAVNLLNVVFIDRKRQGDSDPLQPVKDALSAGYSLVLFPEGTRNRQMHPAEFKSGLFHLAAQFPAVHLVPVYLENLHRILPKGSFLPLPLINRVHFDDAMARAPDESKTDFLDRARARVCALCPREEQP